MNELCQWIRAEVLPELPGWDDYRLRYWTTNNKRSVLKGRGELSEEEVVLIARAKARMECSGGQVKRRTRSVRSVRVVGGAVPAALCSVEVPVVGVAAGGSAGSWGMGVSGEVDAFWGGSLFEEWESLGTWDLSQSHPTLGW